MSTRTILITGATGKQGGAVTKSLEGHGFKLRALTRKPDSDAAQNLKSQGVEIVQGDLNDEASLGQALAGAWGVFAVQNTWEHGVELEEVQGKRIAEMAHKAGVQHFVYSSVGSAHRETGIPHFENKSRVEARVRELKFPSHVILRPVFFMENLPSPWFLNGDTIYTAMKPTTKLQMIAVEDIGTFGATVFIQAEKFKGREIDLAGDELTLPAAAAHLSDVLGRPIKFVEIPIADVRKHNEDFALMLEWFERVGYDANIPALEREFGFKPRSFAAWAEHLRMN